MDVKVGRPRTVRRKARLVEKVRPLFSKRTTPGWLVVILALYRDVPDAQGHFEFWLGAASKVEGHIGMAATLIASPLFNIGLLVAGLSYIMVVGESKQRLRHPIWRVLGWMVAIFVLLVVIVSLTAGYVAVHLPQQQQHEASVRFQTLEQQNETLSNQLGDLQAKLAWRSVTDPQRQHLANVLASSPSTARPYQMVLLVAPDCEECVAYSDDIIAAWRGQSIAEENSLTQSPTKFPDWTASGSVEYRLNPHLRGLTVLIDPVNCEPSELNIIVRALIGGAIPFQVEEISEQETKVLGFTFGQCHLLVSPN